MNSGSQSKPLYENLDTTFVNLWSLLRNLSQRGFVGRIQVELKDYSADIFMDGSSTPTVHEIDRAAGTESLEEAGLHRLVLRARETPGTINVFEGADEAAAVNALASSKAEPQTNTSFESTLPKEVAANPQGIQIQSEELSTATSAAPKINDRSEELSEDIYPSGSYRDWPAILATSGELIGAIERGINSAGEDFDSLFRIVRLELADDYSFLDPMTRTFEYSRGIAALNCEMPLTDYVSGLSVALRRTVDRVAVGERARRVRERVALEMLGVARKRSDVLERSGLQPHLDRIAGTRVI